MTEVHYGTEDKAPAAERTLQALGLDWSHAAGIGELTYDPKATPVPSVVIIVKPHVDPPASVYEDGVTIALVPIVRNHPGRTSTRRTQRRTP